MKKSIYTRTALASLLALCSFSGFATDFSDENMKEMKKQEVKESIATSGKMEVMKTPNKKLKEKMDRICNADPRKKAEELKKKEELKLAAEQKKKEELKLAAEQKKEEKLKLAAEQKKEEKLKLAAEQKKKKEELKLAAEQKKKEEIRLVNEKKAKLKEDLKAKALSTKNSNVEKAKIKSAEAKKAKVKEDIKIASKNVEKANPVVSVGGVDIIDTNQGKDGLRITFGGVVDSQGYGKAGPSEEDYKRYDVMPGRSKDYYENVEDKIKGANPIFPEGIGNIGDYSKSTGMISDAIFHLRAENNNEDLGLRYGVDVQFPASVTEGKGVLQGLNAARGRGAHIFLNSKYGDLKLGYQFGPEALMRLDATRIATIDGAADSNWFRKVNLEGSAASFPFYVTPRLYTESFSSESEKLSFRLAEKYNKDVMTILPFRAAYSSPNYMGARFGISYSPGYDDSLFTVKENNVNLRHIGPDYEHIVSAGASYKYDFNERNIKVEASVVGEFGKAKEPNKDKHLYKEFVEYNDLMGVNLGASADYKIDEDQGIKFAASFAYLGKSGQPKGIKKLDNNGTYVEVSDIDATDGNRVKGLKDQFVGDGKDTMYWTAGAAYQYENVLTSLTYFGSIMNDKDTLHDVALGAQYDLSPACSKSKFVPYAALHYFTTDEKQADSHKITKAGSDTDVAPSNKGFLLLTGVKFSF